MTAPHTNRSMFRRLVRRLLFANRGRVLVILLALSAGAAVSAALLNLQTDAKRRITTEFRSFGPNILVLPSAHASPDANTMPALPETTFAPPLDSGLIVHSGSFLYAIARAATSPTSNSFSVVVTGYSGKLPGSAPLDSLAQTSCLAGQLVAAQLKLKTGDTLVLHEADRNFTCTLTGILKTGGAEDGQVFMALKSVQMLSNSPNQVSVMQIDTARSSVEIQQYGEQLRQKLPDLEVRLLRQFSEAQAKIYSRISGLLTAATALILVLTALCVMAAMTNIAAERKHDVGMMKAIGGSARGILNLFLSEAALLGLAGGLIGAAAGIALSTVLGRAVFGMAAAPRLIVYPISVVLTVIVAILGAYPLRRLANVRPATIFRGDA